jgi:hypothetical protein
MATIGNTTIALRSSGSSGNTPSLGILANGEIAINYADGILYYKTTSNTLGSIRTAQPSGLNQEIQFNDSGSFGANSSLSFNKSSGTLSTNILSANTVTTNTYIQFADGSRQYTANAGSGGTTLLNFNFIDNQFTADGTSNTYTLTDSTTTQSAIVAINGVEQLPNLSYTITGTSLVFSQNIANNDIIDVRIPSFSGPAGTTFITNVVKVNTAIEISSVANLTTSVITTTGTSTQVIDSFSAATFRSASYFVQVKDIANSKYQIENITLLHDGSTSYISEYGVIYSDVSIATFSSTISTGTVQLSVTPSASSSTIKLIRTSITT